MRARGIIGDHAADGGAIGRGYIGCELKAGGAHAYIEVIEHTAWLHARPALVRIDLQNVVEVFGEVQYDAGTDGLAGLRCAAAPCARSNRRDAGGADPPYWGQGAVRLVQTPVAADTRRKSARWRKSAMMFSSL